MRDLEWSMSEAAASMASSSLLAGDGRRSLARDMTRCPRRRGCPPRNLAHMVPDSSKSTSRETSGDDAIDAAASDLLHSRSRLAGAAALRRLAVEERRVVLAAAAPAHPAQRLVEMSTDSTRATLAQHVLPGELAPRTCGCTCTSTSSREACKAEVHRGARFGLLFEETEAGGARLTTVTSRVDRPRSWLRPLCGGTTAFCICLLATSLLALPVLYNSMRSANPPAPLMRSPSRPLPPSPPPPSPVLMSPLPFPPPPPPALVAPQAQPWKPPHPLNMVFMFPDTLRAESFSSYGLALKTTPNLDAFAAEGVRFEQAHALHTQCTPSRVAMLTGRYMHVAGHRTQTSLIQSDERNYYRALKEHGVHVQYYGKNDVFNPESFVSSVSEWSSHRGLEYGPLAYPFGEAGYWSMLANGSDVAKDSLENGDYRAVHEARAWLAASPPEPFLLVLNGKGAHPPYGAPREFHDKWSRDMHALKAAVRLRPPFVPAKPKYHSASVGIPAYRNLTTLPEDAFYRVHAAYLGMVSYNDYLFGELLHGIKAAGLYDRTAVFFSSDHGDFAGDYHLVEKWPGAADDVLTRVPLFARLPNGARNIVARAPVSLFDIPHTMCHLQGINVDGDGPQLGAVGGTFASSLLPTLRDGTDGDLRRVVRAEGGFSSWRDLHPGGCATHASRLCTHARRSKN